MREWKLTRKDPMNLVIATDAGLNPLDPLDDHVWEVSLGKGEPPALAVRSTLGMRAVELRYFPVFLRGTDLVADPGDYFSPPVLGRFFSNYLEFRCFPFDGVEVGLEYWVPGSKILAGRITIVNGSPAGGRLQVDWVGQITPLGEGEIMLPETVSMNSVLAGRCAELEPVCFISGGCTLGTSFYPGLSLELNPRKTAPQIFTWASASFAEKQQSFFAARNTAFRNWEAEISRVETANDARLVEIHTGREDWDAVLQFSQKTGYSLVVPSQENAESSAILQWRDVQNGHSIRGDGKDLFPEGSGLNALDSFALAGLLLPGGAKLLRGFLENMLGSQHKDGSLDWSIGPGRRADHLNAQPVLAGLALALVPYFEDREWLRSLLPQLVSFFLSWFRPASDKDGDFLPEYRTIGQSGLAGAEIPWTGFLESPGLAAMLHSEGEAIQSISHLLGQPAPDQIDRLLENLKNRLQECWDEDAGIFRYRDFETHATTQGEFVVEAVGNGSKAVKRKFAIPQRLFLEIRMRAGLSKPFGITLRGRSQGKAVTISLRSRDFTWKPEQAQYTSPLPFSQLDQIRITGMRDGDSLKVSTIDSSVLDVSLLLAGISNAASERQLVRTARKTIPERFINSEGLLSIPGKPGPAPVSYTNLVMERLLDRGERALAAKIMSLQLDALARKLRDRDISSSNSLENTVPVATFLRICGLEAITPYEIILNDFSPFPGEIRVEFRNIQITLSADKRVIVLNQGTPIVNTNLARVRIPLREITRRS